MDLLQVDLSLGLRPHVLGLCRHVEVGSVTELADGCRCGFGCLGFSRMWCGVQESWMFDAEEEEGKLYSWNEFGDVSRMKSDMVDRDTHKSCLAEELT